MPCRNIILPHCVPRFGGTEVHGLLVCTLVYKHNKNKIKYWATTQNILTNLPYSQTKNKRNDRGRQRSTPSIKHWSPQKKHTQINMDKRQQRNIPSEQKNKTPQTQRWGATTQHPVSTFIKAFNNNTRTNKCYCLQFLAAQHSRQHRRRHSRQHSRQHRRQHSRPRSRHHISQHSRQNCRQHSRYHIIQCSRQYSRHHSRQYSRHKSRQPSRKCSRQHSRQHSRKHSRHHRKQYGRQHSRRQTRQHSAVALEW